jgi:hypothetical protein
MMNSKHFLPLSLRKIRGSLAKIYQKSIWWERNQPRAKGNCRCFALPLYDPPSPSLSLPLSPALSTSFSVYACARVLPSLCFCMFVRVCCDNLQEAISGRVDEFFYAAFFPRSWKPDGSCRRRLKSWMSRKRNYHRNCSSLRRRESEYVGFVDNRDFSLAHAMPWYYLSPLRKHHAFSTRRKFESKRVSQDRTIKNMAATHHKAMQGLQDRVAELEREKDVLVSRSHACTYFNWLFIFCFSEPDTAHVVRTHTIPCCHDSKILREIRHT